MPEWKTPEEATHELQWVIRRVLIGKPGAYSLEKVLQQKWRYAQGGTGDGVKYVEEWRDVPSITEDPR